MIQYAWAVRWSHLDSERGPSVNVVAPNIQTAIKRAKRWIEKDSNSDLNPEDCHIASVVRGVEIG